MKRWGIFLLGLLLLGVAFFAFVYYKPMAKHENNWTLYRADDVCLMSLPIQNIDYSPILSAVFLTHLREHDLPLTFNFSVMSAEKLFPSDSIVCVLNHSGVEMSSVLSDLQMNPMDGNFLYEGNFKYNLSDLLVKMDEMEILELMKTFPASPESIIKFVGTKKEYNEL